MLFANLTHATRQQDAIRIGVTGHRRNRLTDADCAHIATYLGKAFAVFAGQYQGEVTLVSGMADGSDCAAARALPKDWSLDIPLANTPDIWLDQLKKTSETDATTFAQRGPNSALVPMAEPHPNYEGVANFLISKSDLLIGVWNGEPGQPSGTADVMARAHANGTPVFHLPSSGLTKMTLWCGRPLS